MDRDTKKPLAGRRINITTPAAQGLSASESLSPSLSGNTEQSRSLVTDEAGRFSDESDRTVHASYVLGVGALPKKPPPPAYVVRVQGEKCQLAWGMRFNKSASLEYRYLNPTTHEFDEPIKGDVSLTGQLVQATCPVGDISCGTDVKSEITILWDEASACFYEESHPPTERRERKHVVFLSFGDLFQNSMGLGYSWKFLQEAFRLDLPLGIDGNRRAVGLFFKWRMFPVWRGAVGFGVGPAWMRGEGLSNNSNHGVDGIRPLVNFGYDFTLRNGLFFEGGYSSLTIDQQRKDDHVYLRVGWFI